jgi:hypothetical protein
MRNFVFIMKKSALQFLRISILGFKRTFLAVGVFFLLPATYAQFGKIDSLIVPKPSLYFQPEYTFDVTTDPAAWRNQKPGLHVSFASTDRAYFRSEVPDLKNETQTWEKTGWKGERLNAMILAWSPDTINQVRFILNDLKDAKGNVLSKNNFSLDMVRYVLSNDPYDAKDVWCGEAQMSKIYLMPDRLVPIAIGIGRFDIPGGTVRPVWFSVNIPSTAQPGIYKGTIEIKSEKHSAVLNLQIKIQNHLLPKPHDWTFRLDLWQNPWIVATWFGVKPWSAEHKELLKKHLKLYADAGGKFITANVVPAVWADETYGSLVDWIKKKNGFWKFDYTVFDQYIQLAMETGVDKAITIYSPIPYGEAFRYLDEATGNYVNERWSPTSDTFKTNWTIFLADLKTHLEKKGWFNKTYIGINENGPEQTLAAINMVRDQSRKWKITYAGDWHAGLDTLLDDYSSVFGKEPPVNEVKRRSSSQRTSTFYVCCTPPKPNNFVFSPPVEGRWIGWYTYAHSYNGFLRWAYDTWPTDVMKDARNIHWNGEAGDCYMVYPGAGSSIRFEKLREGIVDYEKLKIIKTQAARSSDPNIKKLMQQLEQHLQTINDEHELKKEKLESDIEKGSKLVEELSDKLVSVKK